MNFFDTGLLPVALDIIYGAAGHLRPAGCLHHPAEMTARAACRSTICFAGVCYDGLPNQPLPRCSGPHRGQVRRSRRTALGHPARHPCGGVHRVCGEPSEIMTHQVRRPAILKANPWNRPPSALPFPGDPVLVSRCLRQSSFGFCAGAKSEVNTTCRSSPSWPT